MLRSFLLIFGILFQNPNHYYSNPDSIYKVASNHLDGEKYREAIDQLLTLGAHPKWGNDLNNLRKTFNNLGYAYHHLNQFDSSIYYYQKSHTYAIALKDTTKMISSLNSIGIGHRNLYDFGKALEYSLKALELSQKLKQSTIEINILSNLGLTYRNLGRNYEALSYYRKSYKKAKETLDSNAMARSTHNIALVHKDLESIDSSLYYNFISLELKKKLGNKPREIVSTLNNIGISYLASNEFSKAENYLLESNKIYKQVKDTTGLLISYNNLGNLAFRRDQIVRSMAYLDSGAALFEKTSDLVIKKDNLERRLELLERNKDFEKALPVYRDLTEINERIFQEEKLKVLEVEASFQIREEALLRETAEQQAISSNAEAKSSRQFALFFMILVLVSLIFGLQVFRFNRKLKTKNQIIQDQKRDNEHRIYNFLSRLQGLLRIASDNVSDHSAREILLNSEAAIISAAAIQEHLTYTEPNMEEILVGKYLEGLTNRLGEMFLLTGSHVTIQMNVYEDIKLPVQTILNLGLMVSEMITNSIKYAFPESITDPKIQVNVQISKNQLIIKVGDNGIGISTKLSRGIGIGLINRLANYIQAELLIDSIRGTQYTIFLKING